MQSLLSDIIMDVQELRVLVESGALDADPETGKIVLRKIERMKDRLDSLADEVALEMHKADAGPDEPERTEVEVMPDVAVPEDVTGDEEKAADEVEADVVETVPVSDVSLTECTESVPETDSSLSESTESVSEPEASLSESTETIPELEAFLSESTETVLADSLEETDATADRQELPVRKVMETVSAEPERVMGERMDCFDSLRSSFSLNDSFRFSRELFKGDLQTFYQVVDSVSKAGSRSEAERMLGEALSAVDNEEVAAELFEHVGRFFS